MLQKQTSKYFLKKLNFYNLVKRTTAGAVYIAIVLFALLGGEYAFLAVFGVFQIVGLYEFYRMTEKGTHCRIHKYFHIFYGLLIYLSCFLYLQDIFVAALPLTAISYLLILFISAIFIDRKEIVETTAYSLLGQIYITLPLSILMFISHRYGNLIGDVSNMLILVVFVLIWINDTAAFLFGSLFGKHRLIERISPKKSVEGFVSGILICIIATLIAAPYFPTISIYLWVAIGLITPVFASLGDLFESLLKRTYGVKDSGNIIPGHGGILDRIDSLLVVFPTIYLFLLFCSAFGVL